MLTNRIIFGRIIIADEKTAIEAWLSLVERCVRDAEVVGSNPVASTSIKQRKCQRNQGSRHFLFLSHFLQFVQFMNFCKLFTNFYSLFR